MAATNFLHCQLTLDLPGDADDIIDLKLNQTGQGAPSAGSVVKYPDPSTGTTVDQCFSRAAIRNLTEASISVSVHDSFPTTIGMNSNACWTIKAGEFAEIVIPGPPSIGRFRVYGTGTTGTVELGLFVR